VRLIYGWILPLVCAPLLLAGCGDRDNTPQVAAAIQAVLAAKPLTPVKAEAWTDVREFYSRRQNVPAWLDQGESTSAVHIVRTAREHGLDPADYGEQNIVKLLELKASEDGFGKDSPERARRVAELDVRITTALLSLGRDVALGHTPPKAIDSRWKARRTPPDFVGTLASSMTGDMNAWLNIIRPQHPQYAALQKALVDLRAQQAPTQQGQRVPPDPDIERHLMQLAVNLDRWRWMPDDFGARHVIVNIPSYHLLARDNGQPVLEMRVVVGKPESKTPVFSDSMTTVVFSPYWNIPDSIVEGETAPAAARDPGFLARNNMEILRVSNSGAVAVDPSTVDWDDPEELKQLAFRQKPGAKNALGHVKFLFPNPYDVYLHDTPADQLFARPGRAFSHGCVRVEEPEALAKWVLKDSPEWDGPKIIEAMHAGVEKHVKLKQAIAVHIVYFTAWADDAGAVRFDPDIYGYDATQARHNVEL
jgi:murein L,D-transpeptidase YcbB/YkuD